MLINSNMPQYGNYDFTASSVPPQETLWRGERCIVVMPANSLLCHGGEEITLALAEYAEQRKMTQESKRFLMKRRKQAIRKIRAGQEIRGQIEKRKENFSEEA